MREKEKDAAHGGRRGFEGGGRDEKLKDILGPSRVITVSSGGAYTQKLDYENLNTVEGFSDGTYIYAQNKRQQIALSQKWSRMMRKQRIMNEEEEKTKADKKNVKKKGRHVMFQSMHPGWADTAALRYGMPDFHRRFNSYLRSADQGADTAVWLATSNSALGEEHEGGFFLDRKSQPKFLWGAYVFSIC